MTVSPSTRAFGNPAAAAVLTLLLAMTSIQFGASLAKRIFPLVGPEGTSGLRLGFASLILLGLWRPWRKLPSRKDWLTLLLYGAALGGMNLTFYLALERIPLGIAVAIEFTGPLAVAIFSAHRRTDYLWAALALVGIVLILPLTNHADRLDLVGIGWALLAGMFWALYILFGQRAGSSIHGGVATSLGMLIAALLVVPFAVASAGKALLNIELWPAAFGVAVLSSALPYSLEMISLKRLPQRTFGILMSLEPALGALFGLMFLGEQLSWIQWTAIGCVITASAGSASSSRAVAEGLSS